MVDLDLIRRALAEDLAGGQDITSVATVSGNESVVADFVARKPGVIARRAYRSDRCLHRRHQR